MRKFENVYRRYDSVQEPVYKQENNRIDPLAQKQTRKWIEKKFLLNEVKTEELRVSFARPERQFKGRKIGSFFRENVVWKSYWILKQIHRSDKYEENFNKTVLPLPTETGKVHTKDSQWVWHRFGYPW
jgi:hypothetical protein